MPFVSPNT